MLEDMTLYDVEGWHDFFVAGAGAAAALTGLVFVAVSINIEKVLEIPGAPERGLQTVLILLSAVSVCLAGLIPQTITTLGWELFVGGVVLMAWLVALIPRIAHGVKGHPLWLASRLFLAVPGGLAFIAGGVSLLASGGGGLGWIAAGLVITLIGAVMNAWVLLVEILR